MGRKRPLVYEFFGCQRPRQAVVLGCSLGIARHGSLYGTDESRISWYIIDRVGWDIPHSQLFAGASRVECGQCRTSGFRVVGHVIIQRSGYISNVT